MKSQTTIAPVDGIEEVLDAIKADSDESIDAMKYQLKRFMNENNVSMMGGWV